MGEMRSQVRDELEGCVYMGILRCISSRSMPLLMVISNA